MAYIGLMDNYFKDEVRLYDSLLTVGASVLKAICSLINLSVDCRTCYKCYPMLQHISKLTDIPWIVLKNKI
jgi:hypothetical protein